MDKVIMISFCPAPPHRQGEKGFLVTGTGSEYAEPCNVRDDYHDNNDQDEDFVHALVTEPEERSRVFLVIRRRADFADGRGARVFVVLKGFMMSHTISHGTLTGKSMSDQGSGEL
jgi:hypothetical protein